MSTDSWQFKIFDIVENDSGNRLEISRRLLNADTANRYYEVLGGDQRLWTADVLEHRYEVTNE